MHEINQIVFFNTFIFAIGISAMFLGSGATKFGAGIITAFCASLLNFAAFSNFKYLTAEGQLIGFLIMLVIGVHIFIQIKFFD